MSFVMGIDVWRMMGEFMRLIIVAPQILLERYYPVIVGMQVVLTLLLNADVIYVALIISKRTILSPTYMLTVNGTIMILSWLLFLIYRHPTFFLNFLMSALAVYHAITYLPDIWERYKRRMGMGGGGG
ncbi:MAG: hypothetical protein DRJ67_03735 [Thermoprotei archaeon]|nr:MAG: hypothetical protein DRJ67_03735 [Thermoprotei archaeon]